MTSPTITPVENFGLKGSRKLLIGGALALAAALLVVAFFNHRGLYQIYRFRTERLRLDQENARLAAENERLARTIERLQSDPELIQDLIRRELNFIKKNEIIIQLPPAPAAPRQAQPPGPTPAPAGSPPEGGPPRSP